MYSIEEFDKEKSENRNQIKSTVLLPSDGFAKTVHVCLNNRADHDSVNLSWQRDLLFVFQIVWNTGFM